VERIENAEKMPESGVKWLQLIIFHSRLIVGIGTDGRTQSPIIELSYRWLGIPKMPTGA
jgi:hypothetical protein